MKRILAAVDGSEPSMQAVELAAELATKFQAEFLLICVVEHGSPPDWALAEYVRPDQIGTDMGQFAVSFARDALENARARAVARGIDPVRSEIRVGDPSEEILKFQEETGADAIIIGSRGRGRLAGMLLGSVSQKIASRAPCTVAIAR
jgi:nucleotide-binding universal stress UspA family protein